MRAQLLGIHISLMVHGIAIMLVVAASQGMTPAVRTVALDFSLDSGTGTGADPSRRGGGSGGRDTLPQPEAPHPTGFPDGRTIESPVNPENTGLPDVVEPPPVVSERGPAGMEETTRAAEAFFQEHEASIPAVEKPPPISAKLPVEAEETPPAAQKSTPAHRTIEDNKRIAANETVPPKIVRPKPGLRKKTLETVPEKKAGLDPRLTATNQAPPPVRVNASTEKKPEPLPAVPTPPTASDAPGPLPGPGPVAAGNPSAGTRANSITGLPKGPYGHSGSGSRNGPEEDGAGDGGPIGGEGGSAFPGSPFNFIRGHLKEHLCYPSIARKRGWSGEVMVAFTIYPDGRADNVEIQKSCGISLLDKSALKTVYNACPFPNPPMAARIVIPIVYELN